MICKSVSPLSIQTVGIIRLQTYLDSINTITKVTS